MLRMIIRRTVCVCVFLSLVAGVCADEVKSVCVTEGDSVSLNSDVTEVQREDLILWTFGPEETRIAEIIKRDQMTFRDRLQMDAQTGSLTITNITSEHTGLYKLTVIRNKGSSVRRFNVSVYAPLPVPVISRDSSDCSSSSSSSSVSRCAVVCSAVNVSHVTLSWYRGSSLLSSISVSDLSISLSLPLEVEYQENNTYSCVLNNPISHHTTHLDIARLCQDCTGQGMYAALISLSAVLLAVLAIVMFCLYRKRRQSGPKGNYCEPSAHQTEVAYAETTFVQNVQNEKSKGTEETIYSPVQH